MDIFEKRRVNKVTLDDTVELTCVITTSQKVNDHIVRTRNSIECKLTLI